MSGPQVLKTFPMGKGLELRVMHDPSEPEDSISRWFTEVIADGGPDSEVFVVPAHWHRYHTENMSVIEGRVEATVDGKKKIFRAGDEFLIPPLAVHALQGFKGERLVMREKAEPGGDYKVLFFNDLLHDTPGFSFWRLMRAFYDGDAYISLGLYFRFFDVAFVTVLGGVAKLFVSEKPMKIE
uniref:Cupin type-2 domain-containing protein n=1 Tax=Mycena chlorophos TaxID=658473 RepID=A0ABQ0M253_MYCCL|nr:predicted protein [Mycena chlorophos]